MMTKYFERLNSTNIEDFGENVEGIGEKACQHCGTIFIHTNCTFRIKLKKTQEHKR